MLPTASPFYGDRIAQAEHAYGAHYRRLMQATSTPPALTPPAPTANAASGIAGDCALVVPGPRNNGAGNSGVDSVLDRIGLGLAQGCRTFSLDLNTGIAIGDVDRMVKAIAAGSGVVVVGFHKDDTSLFTPGRPDLDRVPGNVTQQQLVAMAQAFKGADYSYLALSTGGQPKNPTGSLDAQIAARYGSIVDAIRATGYSRNIIVPALGNYGQNLSYYGTNSLPALRGASILFEVSLSHDGNSSKVDATVRQCDHLPCTFRLSVQTDPARKIFNDLAEVGRQIGLTSGRGQIAMLSPFAGEEINSGGGELPMLTGNVLRSPGVKPTLSETGRVLVAAQKRAVADARARQG